MEKEQVQGRLGKKIQTLQEKSNGLKQELAAAKTTIAIEAHLKEDQNRVTQQAESRLKKAKDQEVQFRENLQNTHKRLREYKEKAVKATEKRMMKSGFQEAEI
ncbi:hypothetical protein GGR54DRAFT_637953 [Hypoxylon sp. NC1633]|nr:hypothetical protein GGR54DRAFT_637953 [Hypoxylon sp. NC1633]